MGTAVCTESLGGWDTGQDAAHWPGHDRGATPGHTPGQRRRIWDTGATGRTPAGTLAGTVKKLTEMQEDWDVQERGVDRQEEDDVCENDLREWR